MLSCATTAGGTGRVGRQLRGVGLSAVLVAMAVAAAGCGQENGPAAGLGSAGTTASPGTGGDGDGGTGQGGPGGGGPGQGTPSAGPGESGPVELFRVSEEPVCTDAGSSPPITLEWRVVGTDSGEVTLSIDGPGAFGDYPAEHSIDHVFPCDGEDHTYMITAVVDGETVTESFTLPGQDPDAG